MPPKEVIVVESDDECPRPAKIAKGMKASTASTMHTTPTCRDIPIPLATRGSTQILSSTISSPCEVSDQGAQAICETGWSFSTLGSSVQPNRKSDSRLSSATLDGTPSPTSRSRDQSHGYVKDALSLPVVQPAVNLIPHNTQHTRPFSITDLTDDDADNIFFSDRNLMDRESASIPRNIIDVDEFGGFEFVDIEQAPEVYMIESDSETKVSSKVRRTSRVPPRRNEPVTFPFRSLGIINHNNTPLKCGMVVEIVEPGMLAKDGYFIKIVNIVSNSLTSEVTLRGHRYQRAKDGNGILPKKLNEVYHYREVDLDDYRDASEQSFAEVPLAYVVRTRSFRSTNRQFPRARHIGNSFRDADKPRLYVEGGLTLRWTFTCYYLTTGHRHNNKYGERVLERIPANEASSQYGVTEVSLRERWRGSTIPGGAYTPRASTSSQPSRKGSPFLRSLKRARHETVEGVEGTRRRFDVIDLSDDAPTRRRILPRVLSVSLSPDLGELVNTSVVQRTSPTRVPGQKYTFGDAFCGAGGTTRGAEMAGLKVLWGFDFDQTACNTWRQNFDADCYQMEASEFAEIFNNTDAAKVDILHLSPPCQFFAPCHTRPGPNDEANSAALFAVQEVMKIAKPRIITLEQTLGLSRQQQHKGYLNSLIQMFTNAGFSVRWKVVFLAPWGLPARRERLIVIAACPGEVFPQIPQPTHSENGVGGLKPFETVNATISRLHPSTNLDPDVKYFSEEQLQHPKIHPYDGNKILPKAITCSGGDFNYHPSGKRAVTVREFAALQGFPPVHTFSGMSNNGMRLRGSGVVRKQIGNAVPPVVARTLFESIIKDLKKADGVESEHMLIE